VAVQGSPTAPVQRCQRREHEDGEGRSPGKKNGVHGSPKGSGADEVTDGAARWRFFEGGGTPVSFADGGRVLQNEGVEGGEGCQSIEEEEGRRVGSLEEDGTVGVAALRPNFGKGRGSRCSSTIWTGSQC
jgi:hypothetical protein